MKKILIAATLVAFILVTLSYVTRNTSASFASVNTMTEGEKILSNLSTMRVDSARTRYKSLTPTQKRAVWKAKLDSIEVVGFSDDQIDFINRVSNDLNNVAFDGTYKDGDRWYKESVRLFGRAKAGDLFGRIGLTSAMLNAMHIDEGSPCSCKHNEDFCTSTTIPWHCEEGLNNCAFQGAGCGWLWTGVCDGLCTGGAAN